mmetsp:Transcript_74603/g.161351  ORF Transcript_74603/g.161351 Transcript_74603/m.161351 type:complete len:98 (+) Transcript_74603:282-575(+)
MGNTSVIHTLDHKIKEFQSNLHTRDEQIYSLNSQLHERNNQIQMLKMNENNSTYKMYSSDEKLANVQREVERLRKENYELKNSNDGLRVERSSEATA